MAINKANTTTEEQSFKFLINQSSILHTIDTNRVTVNGVNVIVDKPKRGDVMCITRYKENGVLLDADKQKVIWIDGLSIEPTQLSQEYEPVGICFAVKGNKALVQYHEEREIAYGAVQRWEIKNSPIMNDGAEHNLNITIKGSIHPNPLILTSVDTASRQAFVAKLNAWFLANDPTYSVELVELDTDLPAVDTSDTENENGYINRIILNAQGNNGNSFTIEGIYKENVFAKSIKDVNTWYYKNNGSTGSYSGGYCRAVYYDYAQTHNIAPSSPVEDIFGYSNQTFPVRLVDFTDNPYCQILRDNFANYDEYFDSMMVKYPCSAGGAIKESPSGKDNTYKLANCTYLDNTTGNQEILYPAANWASSISLNAPKLGKGNWWLPSAAEMAQMMRDVTYGTSFWETEPDIINRVISKLSSISNSGWSIFLTDVDRWTSSRYGGDYIWDYDYFSGCLNNITMNNELMVSPITIYEF